jgi:hypothetical protein
MRTKRKPNFRPIEKQWLFHVWGLMHRISMVLPQIKNDPGHSGHFIESWEMVLNLDFVDSFRILFDP